MELGSSELILNADKSVYHLNLRPEELAETIITVGDPDRVALVSQYFDTIEVKKQKREFHTHTGRIGNKRITVISTGIGTDNIDIVLNELDALVNIDFETRSIKKEKVVLDIIRIGTSGAIQPQIPVDSYLYSEYAIGLDNLMHFYESVAIQQADLQRAFIAHMGWSGGKLSPYAVSSDPTLADMFASDQMLSGFTTTNVGFYGPQGRCLRLRLADDHMKEKMASFNFHGKQITNLEMETSGIYGLAALLGHRALSLNCILANRSTGEFSSDSNKAIQGLITYALDRVVSY